MWVLQFAFTFAILNSPLWSYSVKFILPNNCSSGSSDSYPEYFNTANLLCQKCSQNLTFQRQSADGLSCLCQPGYKTLKNFGGNNVECLKCEDGQVGIQHYVNYFQDGQ
ncbi:unnamed protein product [Heterobilharzia americana]|nr:unnamed protein product [Heterobilharzia americana]